MVIKSLGLLMGVLYELFNNYGFTIIMLTLLSKFILLPISILVQKNSIKMVKIQPEINKIKIKYFGDRDKIDTEQSNLYKKEKYNPLISLVPLIIQIILLLGVVEVINNPLTHIAQIPSNVIEQYISVTLDENESLNPKSNMLELEVLKNINNNNIEGYKNINDQYITKIKQLNFMFLGLDLTKIAIAEKGIYLIVPIITALSSFVLCLAQNKMNVLQASQSNMNKYSTMLFSVGLSLYLGFFVSVGVTLYWIFSNLFSIIQQCLLNKAINPKKYVDYDELNKTNNELNDLNKLNKKNKRTKEQIKKEKEDYKKFFSITNKHLVFYSENNGYFKYYKGIIDYLLENTNIIIHYITSDYNDNIFELEKNNKNIKAYYIEEKKLITMMMKMDADVVVMTMPDLQNYHIKRSYVRKDIEYIYIPHGMNSLNLTMKYKSMDNYDTIFAVGKYQKEEALKTDELHKLNRNLVEWGYCLLDDMIEKYENTQETNNRTTILIAPSWQKDNIVDLCIEELLNELKNENYKIVVRPHPQHVRHMVEKFEHMKEKFRENENIHIQTDFSSNDTVFNADLVISDWSGIAYEYAFTTKKPVILIDTPMKIMNEKYEELEIEPFNIWSRYEIGEVVKLDNIKSISSIVYNMLKNQKDYSKKITKLVEDSVYNIGKSGEVGAEYIIKAIQDKINIRKEREKNEKKSN